MSSSNTGNQTALIFSKINENKWIILFHLQKLNFYCILFIGENVIEDTDHYVIVTNEKIRKGNFFRAMSAENNAVQPH